MPVHFEPRLSEIHIDQEAIDAAFAELSADRDLSEHERITLSEKAASIEVLIKTPSRIAKIAADIARHFRAKVEPEGFKAPVFVYDRASCVAHKAELDRHLGPDASTIVMSKSRGDSPDWAATKRGASTRGTSRGRSTHSDGLTKSQPQS